MSRENIELQRRVVEAFNARDIEAFIAYCDPAIEFDSAFAAVGGAVFHGHAGVRKWHQDFEEIWGGQVRVEVETYFDLDEHVLSFYVLRGTGRHSGAVVAMENALVATWRDGRMVRFRVYAHREDALTDLGLSEDALERIAP